MERKTVGLFISPVLVKGLQRSFQVATPKLTHISSSFLKLLLWGEGGRS